MGDEGHPSFEDVGRARGVAPVGVRSGLQLAPKMRPYASGSRHVLCREFGLGNVAAQALNASRRSADTVHIGEVYFNSG